MNGLDQTEDAVIDQTEDAVIDQREDAVIRPSLPSLDPVWCTILVGKAWTMLVSLDMSIAFAIWILRQW